MKHVESTISGLLSLMKLATKFPSVISWLKKCFGKKDKEIIFDLDQTLNFYKVDDILYFTIVLSIRNFTGKRKFLKCAAIVSRQSSKLYSRFKNRRVDDKIGLTVTAEDDHVTDGNFYFMHSEISPDLLIVDVRPEIHQIKVILDDGIKIFTNRAKFAIQPHNINKSGKLIVPVSFKLIQ